MSNNGLNPFFHSISNYVKHKIPRNIFPPTPHLTPHITHLDELRESPVDRGPDWGNVFPEIDRSHRTLRDACRGELESGIDVFVRTRGTEAVEAELLVRVFLPSLGARQSSVGR